jgi:alpha-ketoglutarate-dependent taurine dioxygenase
MEEIMTMANGPTSTSSRLKISRRHPLIGTEVRGIDLREPLDDKTFGELHALWMEHLLLIFPDQPITDEEHIAFGRRFGELEIHPSLAHRSSQNREIYRVSNVDEAGNIIPPKETAWQYLNLSWLWHTDSSFREIPSKGSILHGIETTNAGGNTLFANMYAAYEDLHGDMKARIQGLRVIHDHDFIIKQSKELSAKTDKGRYDEMPPIVHPLVQLHPVTRQRSLFLSPHTMAGIEGMAEAEGRALLDELIAHATQPKYVYRHVWHQHDIIMWDNRCTMHSVEPFDNASVRRIMHRVTLVGEGRPIAA